MQLTPLERLKTHLALAQAAVVLYTLDRQLDAAKLDSHPIQKEVVSGGGVHACIMLRNSSETCIFRLASSLLRAALIHVVN
jgi:1,6-anhydro-N-acetylmuramate kinase